MNAMLRTKSSVSRTFRVLRIRALFSHYESVLRPT